MVWGESLGRASSGARILPEGAHCIESASILQEGAQDLVEGARHVILVFFR